MSNEMTEEKLEVVVKENLVTIDDLRKLFCPNASDKELALAFSIIRNFELNPFKREVHLIKYGNSPLQIIVGYEVYLKRAERSGKLNGWKVSLKKDDFGNYAEVEIYRKDWKEPFIWTAYEKEFSKPQATWKSMPLFMLRKVAIAQAFRICFSDELGGMPYTKEEQDLINAEKKLSPEKKEEIKKEVKEIVAGKIPEPAKDNFKINPQEKKRIEELTKPADVVENKIHIEAEFDELCKKENPKEKTPPEIIPPAKWQLNKITIMMINLDYSGEDAHFTTENLKTKKEADLLISKLNKQLNEKIRKENEEKRKNLNKGETK